MVMAKLSVYTYLSTPGSGSWPVNAIAFVETGSSRCRMVVTNPIGVPFDLDASYLGGVSAVDYYTATNLQTPGQAQVHWDNIVGEPAATVNLSAVYNPGYIA